MALMTVNITGIDKALSGVKSNYDKIITEIDHEMNASVELMATNAKQAFEVDLPEIRNSIRSKKNAFLNYSLIAGTANSPLAAYIEFGTGRYFSQYPGKEKEWQDLARNYYKNGKGQTRPHPYLYPSFKSGLVSLITNIKQVIKRG
jgi:hypothetical protein